MGGLMKEAGGPSGDPTRHRALGELDAALRALPAALFGDNLLVELDLSEGNLPSGARLRVGDAVMAVTPKPHNGCRKFLARVGEDGLRLVQVPATRHLNLRGIFWKVLDAGDVWVAAPVVVLARGATS